MNIDRRDFLKLLGMGSTVFVLGQSGKSGAADMSAGKDDFMFVQEKAHGRGARHNQRPQG
jgi:hypothetical protein